MTDCIGCKIAQRQFTPPSGVLAETTAFVVHQDPSVMIPGFFVLASKAHVRSIQDFTKETFDEFSALLYATRRAIGDLEVCSDITVIQEERSAHFHCWLFPRYPWMKERFETSLASIREIMRFASTTMVGPEAEAEAADLAKKMQVKLTSRLKEARLACVDAKVQAAPICYLEIPAPDIEAAGSFYSSVFGWRITPSNLTDKVYWEFSTEEGRLTGGLDSTLKASDGVIIYLKVSSIAETLKAIRDAGGTIARERFDIGGGYGFSAVFNDPNGNRLGLFSAT